MKIFESERLQRYEGLPNSLDVLKSIALLVSVLDHVGLYFYPDIAEFAIIGRFAAPVFFFVAGFSPNLHVRSSIWWYGLILTGFVYYLEGYGFYLNILLSIGACKLFLRYYPLDTLGWPGLLAVIATLLALHPWLTEFIEYGTAGLAYAFCGSLLYQQRYLLLMPVLLLATLMVHFTDYFFLYTELYQQLMLTGIMALLACGLPIFRYQQAKLLPGISGFVMYSGRYTLQLYVLHVVIFSAMLQMQNAGWIEN